MLAQVLWVVPLGLTGTFLPLWFLMGRLPARRWRWVAYLSVASIGSIMVAAVFGPGVIHDGPAAGYDNPLGIEALRPLSDRFGIVLLAFVIAFLASAASVFWRYRRSEAVPREQIKWLAAAIGIVALVYTISVVLSVTMSPVTGAEPTWMVVLDQLGSTVLILIPRSASQCCATACTRST